MLQYLAMLFIQTLLGDLQLYMLLTNWRVIDYITFQLRLCTTAVLEYLINL